MIFNDLPVRNSLVISEKFANFLIEHRIFILQVEIGEKRSDDSHSNNEKVQHTKSTVYYH